MLAAARVAALGTAALGVYVVYKVPRRLLACVLL